MDSSLPGIDDVFAARERIVPCVHRTPVLTSTTLNGRVGATVFLKCENFQRAGAFKFRGATNAVLSLGEEQAARGVATHSSGNHAQALALAARSRAIPAHIVMPSNAPAAKRAAVEGYGGQITFCESTLTARESTLMTVVEKTGATEIHPYDNLKVIAGQGTAALELLEEQPGIDVVIAPVGGGGLLAGTALTAAAHTGAVEVIGAEPELADDAYRSLQTGKRQPPNPPSTVADGLLTALGELTFPILRQKVSRIELVNDEEILDAMRFLWERVKIVVEPSGAVALAVALKDRKRLRGRSVGIILSGGNVDLCRNELCHFWR